MGTRGVFGAGLVLGVVLGAGATLLLSWPLVPGTRVARVEVPARPAEAPPGFTPGPPSPALPGASSAGAADASKAAPGLPSIEEFSAALREQGWEPPGGVPKYFRSLFGEDRGAAVASLREAYSRAMERGDGTVAWKSLDLLGAAGTPEARAVLLDALRLDDEEHEIPHKSGTLGKWLSRATTDEEATVARGKLRSHLERGLTAWHWTDGYARIVGSHASADDLDLLWATYEGKVGGGAGRNAALQGLLRTGSSEVLDRLLRLGQMDPDNCGAGSDMDDMITRGGDLLFEVLRKHALDPDSPGRAGAAALLGRLEGDRAVEVLLGIWTRADPASRAVAVKGLECLQGKGLSEGMTASARSIVSAALGDEDPSVRRTGAYAVEYRDVYSTPEMQSRLEGLLAGEVEEGWRQAYLDALREVKRNLRKPPTSK